MAGAVGELCPDAQKILAEKGVDAMDVTVGVRPEHITFAADTDLNTITSMVDVSEMMGSEVYLHVTAAGKDVVLRVPTIDLPVEQRSGIPYGSEVHFAFRPELVHLFDPNTEQNLLYGE